MRQKSFQKLNVVKKQADIEGLNNGQYSQSSQSGTLFLVPTPIGNLQDMTFRAVETLKSCDLIAAEDTRNTIKLLNHFEIHTPQISLHEHNVSQRVPQLLEKLMQGENIAQVSDAGMPSISDPGHELVVAALNEKIPVVSLPGATAGMTALIASGLAPQPFTFYGFLPRKKNEQVSALEALENQVETLIFYESPYRLKETIKNILGIFGNRPAVICRELTKVHEEYLRGTLAELLEILEKETLKGECILLVSGNSEKKSTENYPEEIADHFAQLKDQGLTDKEIIKEVATVRKLKKQEVYKIFHEL
ncbi:16S rRNA (cytidine(1402)-2'-O)-methyltransferase [Enterococcus timonensis]|uniref:16S rRNA (cytidine(1402)-2'-O)-methyltransferase n=1 Tax=Enterococcus timonensis TaxID=1852364 RepID=UPI0009F1EFA2|nr:16S rRNA (cytidine(1402)-2'-O)-methyltransferase [Enterococcus timonensis]